MRWVPAFLILAACPPLGAPDAGTDASVSFDAGFDGGPVDAGAPDSGLPSVEPSGHDCPDSGTATACLSEGWFNLSRWTTGAVIDADGGVLRAPTRPVYLDRFFMDRTEVTNEAWLEFVRDGGAQPPPRECGCTNWGPNYPTDPGDVITETSGWTDAGLFPPEEANRPVRCITRQEAAAFCTARQGRLPSALEYQRATRGHFPSTQRYPWGEGPPEYAAHTPPPGFFDDYVSFGLAVPDAVGRRPRGLSAEGVHDLTGGVSEFILECEEDLEAGYMVGESPLIRPPRVSERAGCTKDSLVAGDPYRTRASLVQHLGFVTIYRMPPTSLYARAGERPYDAASDAVGLAQLVFGEPQCGPSLRSASVGFRCAYDQPR